MSAANIYVAALLVLVGVVLGAGLADLYLYLYYGTDGTISHWLRMRPLALLVPIALTQVFLIGLTIHVFGQLYKEW